MRLQLHEITTQGIVVVLLLIPVVLTIWNIATALLFFIKKREKPYYKYIEIAAILTGMLYLFIYADIKEICFVSWDTQLYNNQLHSMVAPDSFVTILTLSVVAFVGYILVRCVPADKQSPIVSAVGIAAVYFGIGICVLWCIQTINDVILIIFPANCIIIFLKTIYILVYQKNTLIQSRTVSIKMKRLSELLNKATNLPWIALLFAIPLLGIIVAVLFLLGQEPNDVIKAWTETADWTLSQKVAPQNLTYDEHYLCTVAAGGHKNIVKPLRTGKRHGHRVVVNRQLCIANAFEQVMEERTPLLHKAVRSFYDSTGYPIAKHIHSPYLADAIYFVMKPLEWMFLLVLYTVDVTPENRIAIQYPHTTLPNTGKGKGV